MKAESMRASGLLAALLLAFALGVYHRPHLPELLPSYEQFALIAPWVTWGWSAALIALGLLFAPACTLQRVTVHALNTLFWFAAAACVSGSVGYTPGAGHYTVLGTASALLLGQAVVHWQTRWRWWQRTVTHPPAWLKRLAQIEHEDDYA